MEVMRMKIKIYKKDDELVGKVIEKDEKEIDFSNLMMIDALYSHNEEVELEFEGLSDTEKTKIKSLFEKIKKIVAESKTSNESDSKL